jgi:hypothetical protein
VLRIADEEAAKPQVDPAAELLPLAVTEKTMGLQDGPDVALEVRGASPPAPGTAGSTTTAREIRTFKAESRYLS